MHRLLDRRPVENPPLGSITERVIMDRDTPPWCINAAMRGARPAEAGRTEGQPVFGTVIQHSRSSFPGPARPEWIPGFGTRIIRESRSAGTMEKVAGIDVSKKVVGVHVKG